MTLTPPFELEWHAREAAGRAKGEAKRKRKAARKAAFDKKHRAPVIVSYVERPRIPRDQYEEYINSDAWRDRRRGWFSRNERRCTDCKRTDGVMHLHHLTYERLGCERDEDLACLCPDDHARRHHRKQH